jgi:hypothetical protein
VNSNHIAVPFRKAHLTLTVAEAQLLLENLRLQLESAHLRQEGLQRPRISDDGYLDLDAFYEFFVQLYPERNLLRSHAGRLFGRLTAAARFDQVAFTALCKKCGRNAKDDCPAGNYLHLSCAEDLKLEVASLKEHSEDFLQKKIHQVGKAVREDFKVLLQALREA